MCHEPLFIFGSEFILKIGGQVENCQIKILLYAEVFFIEHIGSVAR